MYETQYENLNLKRREWKTEEEVRLGWLTELQYKLGITFHAERGRSDADYNRIIIEFKNRGFFHMSEESAKFKEALQELSRYIPAKAKLSAERIQDYLGILIDGDSVAYAYFPDETSAIIHGPLMPLSKESVTMVFEACRNATRRALTATNLIEDFGHGSIVGSQLMQALNDALIFYLESNDNNKIIMLYEEWKALYGQVADLSSFQINSIIDSIGFQYTGHETGDKLSRILFVIHTFDSIIIKLLAAEIVSHFSFLTSYTDFAQNTAMIQDSELLAILNRDIEHANLYSRMNIQGFVEEPLFSWYIDVCTLGKNPEIAAVLIKAIRNVLIKLSFYEYENMVHAQSNDVLKRFYQNIVPQVLRKSLGEFYTPDWLVEITLDKVEGDFSSLRFLDPTCGSASFLIAIIRKIREKSTENEEEQLLKILKNVWGFDLNPLAVQTARVNYLIAISDLIAKVPGIEVEIPVLLADAIYSPAPDPEGDMGIVNYSIGSSKANLTISIPTELVMNRKKMDRIFSLMEDYVECDASAEEMLDRLKRNGMLSQNEIEKWGDILSYTYNGVHELHKKSWDGIWFQVVRNYFWSSTAGEFDVIVGNPPWVRWSKLPELYRERVAPTCRRYDIFSRTPFYGGNELDISGLITYTVTDKWLKDGGQILFLLTQTHFQSASSEGFRRFTIRDNIHLVPVDVEDLKLMKPFPDAANKTSILHARKTFEMPEYPVDYYIWKNAEGVPKSIPENAEKDDVISKSTRIRFEATPVQGASSPWAILPPGRFTTCRKLIGRCTWTEGRKGITCDLNGIYFVNVVNVSSDGKLVQIETRPEAGKTNLGPKKRFWVEPELLYPVVKGASDIEKCYFNPGHSIYAIVPNQGINSDSYNQAMEEVEINNPRIHSYFDEFKTQLCKRSTYKTRMKNAPFYAIYNVGTYTFAPWKVIWPEQPGSKGLPTAVVHTRKSDYIGERIVIPDHKIYFAGFSDRETAEYLCGLLSCDLVQEYITSFNISIQVGDIFQYMNLPPYDQTNGLHLELIKHVRKASMEPLVEHREKILQKISLLGEQIIADWN